MFTAFCEFREQGQSVLIDCLITTIIYRPIIENVTGNLIFHQLPGLSITPLPVTIMS